MLKNKSLEMFLFPLIILGADALCLRLMDLVSSISYEYVDMWTLLIKVWELLSYLILFVAFIYFYFQEENSKSTIIIHFAWSAVLSVLLLLWFLSLIAEDFLAMEPSIYSRYLQNHFQTIMLLYSLYLGLLVVIRAKSEEEMSEEEMMALENARVEQEQQDKLEPLTSKRKLQEK